MSPLDQDGKQQRYSAYLQLTLARFREFIREPAAVFWVYVFPLLLMIALGIAFRNQPVEKITVLISASPYAEELLAACAADKRIEARIAAEDECQTQLRIGKVDLVLKAFPAEADSGKIANQDNFSLENIRCEYAFDPTKPGSVLARNAIDDRLQRAAGRVDVVTTSDREIVEPGGRYIDFLIPGLLGMGIMGGGLFGLGFAIVDMRIRKLLKRFMATPMKRSHFLAAVMTSRMLFTIPEMLFLLVVARLLFGVVIHGNYLAVGMLIFLGTLEFAGIGLLVASRAKTIETVSGLINLVMLPMWMAAGIFFSYERFPAIIQPVIRLLPLTPLIDSLRAVMLEDRPIATLLPQIGIMLAWSIVTFLLALRWFRWN